MSPVPALVRPRRVLPGFGLSLGVSLLFISLVVLLPLSSLVMQLAEMSPAQYWSAVSHPRVLAAYRVTVQTAAIATLINAAIGLLLAWVLVRYDFPGRRLLDALIDLPFALPTAVAGLTLTALLTPNGWYGQWFAAAGIKVAYTPIGIVIAMVFTSLPFIVRTVQPVLEDLPASEEEAALSLGASEARVATRVILPRIWPALASGTALSFVRSLGEFGAIVFIAGNMPYVTEVASLMVFIRLQEFNHPAASAVASVLLLASLLLLWVINLLQARYLRRYGS